MEILVTEPSGRIRDAYLLYSERMAPSLSSYLKTLS